MSRNDPCACGSGRRFKHCHGRLIESISPGELHREALRAHRSGALAQAEALYRRALESNSRDADSLHMLGIVQFERLRYRDALELMWDAAELTNWSDGIFRQNIGLVLAKLLGPRANARQKAFVAAYLEREQARKSGPVIAARVSIVLTIGSMSRFVARAVASVARQTYPDIEVIVSDYSGSGQAVRMSGESLSRAPFPVTLVESAHRDELDAANEGAKRAGGRYLAFLSADEWFAPDRIERMVAEIARPYPLWGYSGVGFSESGALAAPRVAGTGNASPGQDFRAGKELPSFTLLRRNASESTGNLFVERDLFLSIGGYARDARYPGWDVCVRAAKVVEPVAIAQPLYFQDDNRATNRATQPSDRFVDALVADALNGDAAASNPFCPHFTGNRDLLLRAELRAGRGDRLPVAVLRALAAEWLSRTPARGAPAPGDRAQPGVGKVALVVLGVYRSGTSAIARTLNLCGAFLPAGVIAEDLLLNPTGFWEAEGVNDLDARLLHNLGAAWNRVDFELPREGPLINEFLTNARELLEREYGEAPLILMKDPRMGVLAPLWDQSVRECGYRAGYVVAVRNPLEVARSFEAHGDMPIADGLRLWLAYMERIASFIDSGRVDAICVRYTDLLDDWRSVVRSIARRLDVPLGVDERGDEVDRFLDAAMRKHRATQADLEQHLAGETGEAIRALYRKLLDCCDRDARDGKATPPQPTDTYCQRPATPSLHLQPE